MDKLTKSTHFLSVRLDYSMDRIAELYVSEIVRLHGIPLSIVSDRDPRFTSKFWKELQSSFGTRLNFNTAFHPQTNGQSKRVIQVLEDMLRGCVLDFSGSWDMYIPLMEFAYCGPYPIHGPARLAFKWKENVKRKCGLIFEFWKIRPQGGTVLLWSRHLLLFLFYKGKTK